MFKIINKEAIAPLVEMLEISAPHIAKHAKVGNFVVLRLNEKGERIPLTIADFDRKKGTITLLFQKVGKTTEDLGMLNKGDEIRDITGPLGRTTPMKKYGHCILIAGGMGSATLYPIVKELKKLRNKITVIMGARSKDLLIWVEKFNKYSDKLLVTTDDGSLGRKGLVTDALKDVIKKKSVSLVVAVGPVRMMKAVSDVTKPYGIKTIVSLNPLMVEGTGMCGACRVSIAGETKFACIDGPEFDGHAVDFQGLENRLGFYKKEEETAYKLFKRKRSKQ